MQKDLLVMIFNFEKKYIFVRSHKVASMSLMSAIIKAEAKSEEILKIGNLHYQNPLFYSFGKDSKIDFPATNHISINKISC